MVISVMSPHCSGNGNTVTSILLALGLGAMRKNVLLTHTDSVSNSLYMYLGLQNKEDKTSTPTQMVKLLREGAIQAEAIPDYCKSISENTYVFTNNSTNFNDDDMLTLSKYLVDHSTFDYLIYDFNNYESETSKYILKKTDVVVLNFTQSFIEIDKFKEEMQKYSKMFAGKKLLLVCNQYNSLIGKDSDVPKRLGVKAPVMVIHYNPWIVFGCNTGQLLTIYGNVRKKNSKVVELGSDINRLANTVSKLRIKALKSKQEEKKKELSLNKGGEGT